MPLQNRVLPTGDIVAIPARGTFTGNRGIIHREDQTLGTSRWTHHAWICCTLDWQGRKRKVMTGRNWTELFFLDEAVAMAAGHRPCGYCRRTDYNRFVAAWADATGQPAKANEIDAILHKARIVPRSRIQQNHVSRLGDLPQGALIIWNDAPHLVSPSGLFPYTPDGYTNQIARPKTKTVTVLTPKPLIAVLQAGYTPVVHPTATIDVSPLTA